MKTTGGLWIDHRKAVIVAVTDKGEEIKLIISKVEKQPGRPGGIRSKTPYESQLVSIQKWPFSAILASVCPAFGGMRRATCTSPRNPLTSLILSR